jgi:hypothetical protein
MSVKGIKSFQFSSTDRCKASDMSTIFAIVTFLIMFDMTQAVGSRGIHAGFGHGRRHRIDNGQFGLNIGNTPNYFGSNIYSNNYPRYYARNGNSGYYNFNNGFENSALGSFLGFGRKK